MSRMLTVSDKKRTDLIRKRNIFNILHFEVLFKIALYFFNNHYFTKLL
jgi:hypothetical protein